MRYCIVNYITRNDWHPFGQQRLIQSLHRVGFKGDVFGYDPTTLESPPHHKIPYAFKLYALKKAQLTEYDMAIWVDASFWAVHPVDSLFDLIQKNNGVLVQDSGYPLGQWSSDISLNHFGILREDAFHMPMFAGGLIGIDFNNPIAKTFFEEFYQQAKIGIAFRGEWSNGHRRVSIDKRVLGHRHDMVVGSILMKKYGLKMQENNSLFSYYAWYEQRKSIKDLSKIPFVIEGGTRQI